jgi:hypothetical protein
MIPDLEDSFVVGEDTFFDSFSPTLPFGVTFEDDLTTCYFYATASEPEFGILDTLHIYNVADVVDKAKPCTIQIAWTDDGTIASLLINNYCHAIFDLENRAGYCRNAFPDCQGEWALISDRKLTEEFIGGLEGR